MEDGWGGGFDPQDLPKESTEELRIRMWNGAEWVKRSVWRQQASCGKVVYFDKIYLRRRHKLSNNEVLEHITVDEYIIRKLAGTLEDIPEACLNHGFTNGDY